MSAAVAAQPGRSCPLAYRYRPRAFDREPELAAETLYVVGGLYGNPEALQALGALVRRERGPATVVFNGDFHWFDVDAADFGAVEEAVARHHAIRGNVETEIAHDDPAAGCGCAYPEEVSDADVERSNAILNRLRETARGLPEARRRLAALPMHLVARVGESRVGIVHGDATSLAGWGFARDRLDTPAHRRWIEAMFREARVDIFASSHTCLPALRTFDVDGTARIVANNGAAGMPNVSGTRFGIVTRIAVRPLAGTERLDGLAAGGAFVESVRLDYDHGRWLRRFLRDWPQGSPAHASYFRRMVHGPETHGAACAGGPGQPRAA